MGEIKQENLSLTARSAWVMFAKVIGFILSFLLPVLTVRYLTQENVGIYRQVFLVITTASAILPIGFSMSAFYFLAREPENRARTILNILLFNFVMGGAACLLLNIYPQLLGNIFQNSEMTRLAPQIGVVLWLWIFSTFLEIVVLANQETRLAVVFMIMAQLTKTILMVGAVIFFSTVDAFLTAAMIQTALQTCVLLIYLNSRFQRFWLSFNWQFFRLQFIYAIPFGISGIFFTIQYDLHNYFVGYRFSATEYAIYVYGCFEVPLITMLYESFSAVMIPQMSKLQSEGKKREMLELTVGVMRKLAFVYLPLFTFLMIVAEEFIITLFTENFRESVSIFRINLFIFPFYCLMLDPIARSFKEIGSFLLKIRLVLFFALVAALWYGIQHFTLQGMILIVVCFLIFERLVLLAKTVRVLEAKWEDIYLLKNIGTTLVAAALAGIILAIFYWFVKDTLYNACIVLFRQILFLINFEKAAEFFGGSFFLGICLLIFASIYLFFADRFGAIEPEEKQKLLGGVKKLLQKVGIKTRNKKIEEPGYVSNS